MPDVKHCGGLLELTHIAAVAERDGVAVAPHNPSGPVSTAASVQVGAVLKNFRLLEFQWGESPWRHDVVSAAGTVRERLDPASGAAGLGIDLNDAVVGPPDVRPGDGVQGAGHRASVLIRDS